LVVQAAKHAPPKASCELPKAVRSQEETWGVTSEEACNKRKKLKKSHLVLREIPELLPQLPKASQPV